MSEKEMRGLDAWIAEHVMGWMIKSRQCPTSGSVTEHFWFEPGNEIEPKFRSSTQRMFPSGTIVGERCAKEIPSYTTDPAAALAVLEKCHQKLTGGIKTRLHASGKWTVSKYEDLDPIWSKADTLPLAICLFAKQLFSNPTP